MIRILQSVTLSVRPCMYYQRLREAEPFHLVLLICRVSLGNCGTMQWMLLHTAGNAGVCDWLIRIPFYTLLTAEARSSIKQEKIEKTELELELELGCSLRGTTVSSDSYSQMQDRTAWSEGLEGQSTHVGPQNVCP